jgi:hypothetical protein
MRTHKPDSDFGNFDEIEFATNIMRYNKVIVTRYV